MKKESKRDGCIHGGLHGILPQHATAGKSVRKSWKVMLIIFAVVCSIFAFDVISAGAVSVSVQTDGFTADVWEENQITLKNFGTNKEILIESQKALTGAYKVSMVFSTNGHDNAGWDSQFVLGGKTAGAAGFRDTDAIMINRCVNRFGTDHTGAKFMRYQVGQPNTVVESTAMDINELGYMAELQIIEFEVADKDKMVTIGESRGNTLADIDVKAGDILISYDNVYTAVNFYRPPVRHVIRFPEGMNSDFSVTNGIFGFAPYFVGTGSVLYDFDITSVTMIDGDGTVTAENFNGDTKNINVVGDGAYYEYTVQSETSARGGIANFYDMRDCHETKMISKSRVSGLKIAENDLIFDVKYTITRTTTENGIAAGWGLMFGMPSRDADITTLGVYYLYIDYKTVVLAKVNENGKLAPVDASQNIDAANAYFPGSKIDIAMKAYQDGRLEVTVDPISDAVSSMSFTGIDAEGYFGFISDRRELSAVNPASEIRFTRIENLGLSFRVANVSVTAEYNKEKGNVLSGEEAFTGGNYEVGTEIQLKIEPANGYAIASVTFNGTDVLIGENNLYVFSADIEGALTILFVPVRYMITYHFGSGTAPETYAQEYNVETEAVLPQPIMPKGMYFAGWYSDENLTVLVEKIEKGRTGDIELFAKCVNLYTVTINQAENGIVVCDRTENIDEGELVTITVMADQGYQVKLVKVNGETVTLSGGKYVIDSIEENLIVDAEFEKIPDGEETKKRKGCSGSLSSVGGGMLALLIFGVLNIKKRIR